MSFLLKSRLYCGTPWSSEEGSRGSSQVVVFVLWSTKYTLAVFVSRISQPLGNGPSCDTGCCWMVALFPPAFCGPYIRMYCCRLGSTHVVVRVLWSTKYALPSGVLRCSQPAGSSPVPAVVAPVAIMETALELGWLPPGGSGTLGELVPVLSSGSIRF